MGINNTYTNNTPTTQQQHQQGASIAKQPVWPRGRQQCVRGKSSLRPLSPCTVNAPPYRKKQKRTEDGASFRSPGGEEEEEDESALKLHTQHTQKQRRTDGRTVHLLWVGAVPVDAVPLRGDEARRDAERHTQQTQQIHSCSSPISGSLSQSVGKEERRRTAVVFKLS